MRWHCISGVHVMVCPFAGGYEASAQRNRHREDLLGSQKEQEERMRAKAQVGQDNQVGGCVNSLQDNRLWRVKLLCEMLLIGGSAAMVHFQESFLNGELLKGTPFLDLWGRDRCNV